MLILRRGWACWRKQQQQQEVEDEQASDTGDAPDAQDGSRGHAAHCPLCDLWLNGPTQDYDHRWHKDIYTGVITPSDRHHRNFGRALAAAQSCGGPEVTFNAQKAGQRTVTISDILKEFKRMRPSITVPAYLQIDTAEEGQEEEEEA